jgi:hypothetical protein
VQLGHLPARYGIDHKAAADEERQHPPRGHTDASQQYGGWPENRDEQNPEAADARLSSHEVDRNGEQQDRTRECCAHAATLRGIRVRRKGDGLRGTFAAVVVLLAS